MQKNKLIKKDSKKNNLKFSIKEIPIMLIISILSTFLLQTVFDNPFTIKLPILMYNILIHFIFLFFLRSLVGSLKWGIRVFTLLIWIFGTTNFLVIEFRSTPFMPWDIYSWQTAANVVTNYSLPFSWRYLLTTLGFIAIFIFTFFLKKINSNENNNLKQPKKNQTKGKAILNNKINKPKSEPGKRQAILQYFSLLLIGIVLLFSTIIFSQTNFIKDSLSLNTTLFNSRGMARDNGFLFNFVYCTRYLSVDKPEDYSSEKVKEILEEIDTDSVENESEDNQEQATKNEIDLNQNTIEQSNQNLKPDIIVVMDESFSDLQQLADFETNIDYMPFYRNFNENVKKGITYSSVIGGNTASSEFEFLTGMSMGFLPSGSIAYMQFIRQPLTSIVSVLENYGYSSTAMHPYYQSGWNRQKVYEYLGFDKIKFNKDFTYQEKVRKYISDESLFNEILMELDENNSDTPQFIFTVSMQNHGGYTDTYRNFTNDVKVTSGNGSDALNQYLSLLKVTDQSLEKFIETLEQRDRPTILLFFGDHQPNNYTVSALTKNMSEEKLQENRRKSNYFLWANYPLSDQTEEDYSNNYLSYLLLKESNIPLDNWYKFLGQMHYAYPVINDAFYFDRDGEKMLIEGQDFSSEMNDYAILQYDYLFGKTFEQYR